MNQWHNCDEISYLSDQLTDQYRSTFSYTNDLYMDSSVSSGFTNFAICGSDDMYNTLYNLSVL